jgi:hypothetical protein
VNLTSHSLPVAKSHQDSTFEFRPRNRTPGSSGFCANEGGGKNITFVDYILKQYSLLIFLIRLPLYFYQNYNLFTVTLFWKIKQYKKNNLC